MTPDDIEQYVLKQARKFTPTYDDEPLYVRAAARLGVAHALVFELSLYLNPEDLDKITRRMKDAINQQAQPAADIHECFEAADVHEG